MSNQGVGAYKLSKLALNGLTHFIAAAIKGDIKIIQGGSVQIWVDHLLQNLLSKLLSLSLG
jgi:hypothetical protein